MNTTQDPSPVNWADAEPEAEDKPESSEDRINAINQAMKDLQTFPPQLIILTEFNRRMAKLAAHIVSNYEDPIAVVIGLEDRLIFFGKHEKQNGNGVTVSGASQNG